MRLIDSDSTVSEANAILGDLFDKIVITLNEDEQSINVKCSLDDCKFDEETIKLINDFFPDEDLDLESFIEGILPSITAILGQFKNELAISRAEGGPDDTISQAASLPIGCNLHSSLK